MPRISRWAGGGEKFYRLKTARGVKNLGSTTLPDCVPLSQFVISLGLSFFKWKMQRASKGHSNFKSALMLSDFEFKIFLGSGHNAYVSCVSFGP